MEKKAEILRRLGIAVVDRDPALAELTAREALQKGIDPLQAIEKGLIEGITTVGDRYQAGEFFLPDLVMGAEAFKAGIGVLEPELVRSKSERKRIGTVLLGTVAGDIHSIGKDIVSTLLTAAGLEIRDVGVDVSDHKFTETVGATHPDILAMSALMSTTIGHQRDVIQALEAEGLRNNVRVLIGGAATSDLWKNEIGADGWAATAIEGVKKAQELLGVE